MYKQSAIREMFLGKRGTYADIELSDEYRDAEEQMEKAVDAFLEQLTPKQQQLFYEAYEYIADKSAAYAEDHFVEGFKFGLTVGFEAGERRRQPK